MQTLQQIKQTIAVASGKGGVGKSTVAVHLTLALAKLGARAGLLDADIYGPSIPTMLGITQKPDVEEGMLKPIETHGIKTISMGMLMTEDSPVIWRGPMVSNVLEQFLTKVNWGELDFLIIDMPPGTGDAQLTLAQKSRLAGAVIVTTPQEVALLDARRGLKMFQQVQVPVLGIVENMSYFICDQCNKRHTIFKEGGGKKVAAELNLPFLGELPIDPKIAEGGDKGMPVISKHYLELAKRVTQILRETTKEMPEEFHLKW